MKKKKIVIYSVILVILLCCISLGTAAILAGNQYKNNNISFVVEDDEAYCMISGEYFYNGESVNDKTYTEVSYKKEDYYSEKGFSGFKVWDIGDSYFDSSYDSENLENFEYKIQITNLNEVKNLVVSMADVAVGEKVVNSEKEILFYTTITYQIDNGSNNVMFCNKEDNLVNYDLYSGNQKVSINNDKAQVLEPNQKISIGIKIERKTKVTSFNIKNNIKISLSTQ